MCATSYCEIVDLNAHGVWHVQDYAADYTHLRVIIIIAAIMCNEKAARELMTSLVGIERKLENTSKNMSYVNCLCKNC